MGYESKLVLVNVMGFGFMGRNYAEVVAEVNCSCMGPEFFSFWRENSTPIGYDVYIEDENEPTREDKYGAPLTEAPIGAVLDWLKSEEAGELKTYRRAKLLVGLLKSIKPKDWEDEDLRLVHYGY